MPKAFDTPAALARALAKAADEVKGLDEASAQLGATLVSVARQRIRSRTGNLSGSVRFAVAGNPGRGLDSKVTVSAGNAKVPYAGPIHWGWPGRGIAPAFFLVDPLGRMVDTDTIDQAYAEKVSEILEKAL